MKKIIWAVLIVLVIIITAVFIINGNRNQNSNEISAQNYVSSGKYTDVRQERPLIEYDGYYGDDYGTSASVFYVDENTVNISFNIYRYGGFFVKNVKIDKNGIGKFYAEYADISEGIIIFDEGKITVKSVDEEQNDLLKDENGNPIVLEKKSTKIVTEQELEEELQKALNDFNDINTDLFDVENGTKYITLSLKPTCYIKYTEEYDDEIETFYGLDEEGHYYTIDKENKKYITLEDLYPNIDALDEYIMKKIEEKKDKWEATPNEYNLDEWPYYDFEGIGEEDYFENYFKIDELNNTVSIRVLDYPYEAVRDLGVVWVDVPLTLQ